MRGDHVDGSAAPWALDLRGTDPSALARIRRWTARTLPHLGDDHLHDVLLVIDELAANAYLHGGGPIRARITALTTPCRVVVEVDDLSPAHPLPHRSRPGLHDASGYGMAVIQELADTWSVHDNPDSDGKTVWARLSCGSRTRTPCH
ncbi:ATPase [Amycolatopsis mediterranei S699]|uniref:Predicted ATPase n=2 Tax=Amycolatopsis mediterranei TaxID=33910 RepID=A0A0H3DDR2_AMYMU|nr:ATP-binding protein [Amycolatopsis mediterranei]ADJ48218.1 predicted ATPase [Amycolatopsis mediterranei U32]AEK45125.1 ATPase [Amycolatopsis mediterranei S699]AFO79929.1 ATPase [Amycolatopsis mediterranei S699]AGT87057.1 ATPase [Amycolatopsis mediterranei RB]KDO10704.1 ATPase [Amycolatopsis mediterranei]